jgi:hypothetical protein
LGVQWTLRPIIIRGIEKRPILADHLGGEWFISRMGQLTLEAGTRI